MNSAQRLLAIIGWQCCYTDDEHAAHLREFKNKNSVIYKRETPSDRRRRLKRQGLSQKQSTDKTIPSL